MSQQIFIGIDFGTSGCRACAIDEHDNIIAMQQQPLPEPLIKQGHVEQDANLWWQNVNQLLDRLFQQVDTSSIRSIAIDGTSGTVLLTDEGGKPLCPALMYNDSQCRDEADAISAIAPENSAAHGSSSGLAKLIHLYKKHPEASHALHQADWIAGMLCGNFSTSDENNALKSGYDPVTGCWPEWIEKTGLDRQLLPTVVKPGSLIGTITKALAKQFKLPQQVRIIAGTTDSIAAFIATGACCIGDAVTSLGSTMVLKIISDKPVFSPQHGIYSHKLGQHWLAGGASNSGGNVLRHFFSDDQMREMSSQLLPDIDTGLDYYPLLTPGERFPVSDPGYAGKLTPRPASDSEFFQGLLEGMAMIECHAYKKLQQLGAPYPARVFTAGGGSKNQPWRQIRSRRLGVSVLTAKQVDACFGAALLAKQGAITG
ncbi:MAG: FGGY-family carbohydrate kinase [Gammaproteobacteria bacterium]|nr:FGGY-family carbohydrate kinase [Gammaproteobacteria bacterium]